MVREIEDALRIAERSGDDLALAFARVTLGVALVHRHTAAERDRGQKLLAEVSEVFLRRGYNLCDLPIVNVYVARERARRGDRDDAIPLMRAAADHLFREGLLLSWGIPATGVLVETLLDSRGPRVTWPKPRPRSPGWRTRQPKRVWLSATSGCCDSALYWRGPRATTTAYRDFRDRYRDMATTLGFEGHIDWAEAMP